MFEPAFTAHRSGQSGSGSGHQPRAAAAATTNEGCQRAATSRRASSALRTHSSSKSRCPHQTGAPTDPACRRRGSCVRSGALRSPSRPKKLLAALLCNLRRRSQDPAAATYLVDSRLIALLRAGGRLLPQHHRVPVLPAGLDRHAAGAVLNC